MRDARKANTALHRLSVEELFEEIRVTIKGGSLQPTKPLIALEDYLSPRREVLHGDVPRTQVYGLAEAYQAHLTRSNRTDEMDAARLLYAHDMLPLHRWDYVLVDEAQDYALVQLVFLAKLGKQDASMVFVGDVHQVVYASHFNWDRVEEALRHAGKRSKATRQEISVNYRNPRGILLLGAEVLAHCAVRLNSPVPPTPSSNQSVLGRPLRLVLRSEDDLRQFMADIATSVPSLGVLYPSSEQVEANQWSFRGIDFRRGFSPQSAKGLEFQVVCLVGFGLHYGHLRLNRRSSVSTETFQFHELYVSVTRPRQVLMLVDVESQHQSIWDEPRYLGLTDKTSDAVAQAMAEGAATSETAGWQWAAMDFERQQAFGAAAECWAHAEAWFHSGQCLEKFGNLEEAASRYAKGDCFSDVARVRERLQQWALAGNAWEQAGLPRDAARCFENAGFLEDAARIWAGLGNIRTSNILLAKICESRQDYASASRHWELADEIRNAAAMADKDGDFSRSVPLWRSAKEFAAMYAAIARLAERERRFEDAAYAWKNAKNFLEAGRCFEAAEKWQEAAALWKQIGDRERATVAMARDAESHGNLALAADTYAAARLYGPALALYVKLGDDQNANRMRALELEGVEQWADAGAKWLVAHAHGRAARCFERARDHVAAAEAWMIAAEHRFAALNWQKAGQYRDAEKAFLRAGDEKSANFSRATYLVVDGEFAEAGRAWIAADEPARAAAAWKKACNYSAAAKLFLSLGDTKNYTECSALLHESSSRWAEAQEKWRQLGNFKRARMCQAHVHEHVQEWRIAGQMWQSLRQDERALACFHAADRADAAAQVGSKDWKIGDVTDHDDGDEDE